VPATRAAYDRRVTDPLVVAAAIVDDLTAPTRLLSGRRSAPKSLAGRWEFPGGKVEPDEDAVAALHRELREELGVTAHLGAAVPGPDGGAWPITHGYRMRVWLATVDGEPAPLADHDELRWLPLADAADAVPWLDANLPIVHRVVAQLRG
jgi:8-oxo-dGTP diphosphatase